MKITTSPSGLIAAALGEASPLLACGIDEPACGNDELAVVDPPCLREPQTDDDLRAEVAALEAELKALDAELESALEEELAADSAALRQASKCQSGNPQESGGPLTSESSSSSPREPSELLDCSPCLSSPGVEGLPESVVHFLQDLMEAGQVEDNDPDQRCKAGLSSVRSEIFGLLMRSKQEHMSFEAFHTEALLVVYKAYDADLPSGPDLWRAFRYLYENMPDWAFPDAGPSPRHREDFVDAPALAVNLMELD